MFVAASTECLPYWPLGDVLDQLLHLQFTTIELNICETGGHMKPSQIDEDYSRALAICRASQRLDICAFKVDPGPPGDVTYRRFNAICKLAKAVKVVSITVPSAELGTPFNEEVEHLRRLVGIAGMEGIRVSIRNEVGRISQDPDTLRLLCNHVEGLGITFDPSHYIHGPYSGVDYESLLKFVYHVQLRDTSKSELQVRVGQGEVEYGKIVNQLAKVKYDRALCVDIRPPVEMDKEQQEQHFGELRKLRLLLESLLM